MPEVIETCYVATYHCDECTHGRMYPTGVLKNNMIEHQCHVCGAYQDFDKCYTSMWVQFAEGPNTCG